MNDADGTMTLMQQPAGVPANTESVTDKVNILVVDDNPDKLLVFQTILEELDENVVTARSGKEALKYMLEREFAVILLDVKMPEMDGFETAALIRGRKKYAHTPIIFVTAYADEMHTAEGYSLGAVDYILTPIVPDVLRSKVRVFVQLLRMSTQVRSQVEERVALVREQAARAAAEESIRRSNFLAEASQVLSHSLDVEATANALTCFAVPYLGDLCGLAITGDDGDIARTHLAWAAGHSEELRQATVANIANKEIAECIRAALSRGEPCHVDLARGVIKLEAGAKARSERETLPLGFRMQQIAIYPLAARGRVLGALIVGFAASHRAAPAEQALARDLAERTAIAIDNAFLYLKMQDADRRKDEFLAMLAHELRNPLAPIRSAVAVMRYVGAQEPTQHPTLQWSREIIDRQVEHLTRLVDDLLDVSRLTQGKIRLEKETIPLHSVIERAVETSKPAIDNHKHHFTVTLPQNVINLSGDSVRLAQVFSNLLNNAAKYTPEGGQIVLAAEVSGGEVCVRVKDNGGGISADVLPHIFDLFTQANRSLARSEGGLGIGLTLVRNLVEKHDGSVEAKSEGPGKGSEFVVRLPVLSDALTVADAPPAPQPRRKPAALRILLIDDNTDSNNAMETLLRLFGHEVATAPDGVKALQHAREFKPQLVLCDIGLPGMDGYEVVRRLRAEKLTPEPLIAALTGYAQAEDSKRSQDAGFDVHLVKPVDPEALRALIDAQAEKFAEDGLAES